IVRFVSFQPIDGVLEYWKIQRVVLGQFSGPLEWRLSAIGAANPGDLIVIGAHDDARHKTRTTGRGNAPCEQRVASKPAHVFSGDALRTAARGNHGENLRRSVHHAVHPPSTTRLAPVMYEEASERRKTSGPPYSSCLAMRPIGVLSL